MMAVLRLCYVSLAIDLLLFVHIEDSALLTCQADQFQCDDGQCVPESWKCDRANDCVDGSDEKPEICDASCHEGEFRCDNGICISEKWKCDGDDDCGDNSDEKPELCALVTCQADQFQCVDGQCVPESWKCDRANDCVDGSDEKPEICETDPCLTNNGGCDQRCVFSPGEGYRCECNEGYSKIGNHSCEDIDECMINNPPTCSQKCINTNGSYICECENGYTLENQKYCRVTGERPWLLLATNRRAIRLINTETGYMKQVVGDLENPVSVDYDFKDNLTFWSVVTGGQIMRLDNGGSVSVVVNENVATPDGIAVDWIYKHVYWTDSENKTIELAKYDGSLRTTLIDNNLDKPRAIVVDPQNGWMYWTDWGEEARIERCGMNGQRRDIIVNENIVWPNGLTIDYIAHKLYWVDAKFSDIKSANFDGSNVRIVVDEANLRLHPFSIAVFEDFLYWTTWRSESVKVANKLTGGDIRQLATGLIRPMGIRVFHNLVQADYDNYCPTSSESMCSHLCLPTPLPADKKYSCACPNSSELMRDEISCKDKVPCRDGWFQCDDSYCIDGKFRCDGVLDCTDESDESNCGMYTTDLNCYSNKCQKPNVYPKGPLYL